MRLTDFLGLLLSIVVAISLIVPKVVGAADCTRHEFAQEEVTALGGALDHFRLDFGRYPKTNEGLAILKSAPAGVKGWNGPYSYRSVVQDTWGHPYLYRSNGQAFILVSWGADGISGGQGEDADLTITR